LALTITESAFASNGATMKSHWKRRWREAGSNTICAYGRSIFGVEAWQLGGSSLMSLVELTRPDGSPVAINPDEVVQLAPVPSQGPLMGPLAKGTRIVFRNQTHQDVKELQDEVIAKINTSRTQTTLALASLATKSQKRATKPRKRT
jgi:hypothetical protein